VKLEEFGLGLLREVLNNKNERVEEELDEKEEETLKLQRRVGSVY
jgi:hypothetical protein